MYIIYPFLGAWFVYAIFLFRQAKREPAELNTFHFQSIPGVFTTLGVLGTFIGITISLIGFDVKNIDGSIGSLLEGMKTAFISSLIGISLSLISSWIVKDYLHRYGSKFPVPESEETTALKQVVKAVKEARTEISAMREAFINTNTDSAKRLLAGISETNSRLIDLNEQTGKDTKEMVRTLNRNHELMDNKFTEFAELLADANTDALKEAMEKLIQDFSDTFKTLIESLVNQNFEELNNSVAALNAWQQQHREEVDRLHQRLSDIISQLSGVSNQLTTTSTTMEISLENTAGSLEKISGQTERLVDDNGRLANIIKALEKVLIEESHLTQAFDKAVIAINQLQAGTKEFEAAKKQITDWLNREQGISSAMTLFNAGIAELKERLSALDKIKMEDLKILDNSFDKRLGAALDTSFSHLDRLIKEYVTFMEKNRKIEIQIKDKENGKV